MNWITQQLKERVRKKYEGIETNFPMALESWTTENWQDEVEKQIETTITELIEHIEGEIMKERNKTTTSPENESSEMYGARLEEQAATYKVVLSLLSDIKQQHD